eukprot:4862108-Amphidinium_carterae.1
MPVVWQDGGSRFRRGIGKWGSKQGSHTLPGCLRESAPLLQADRTEKPRIDEIESLLQFNAGPAKRPIPHIRTFDGAVTSIIGGVEKSCLTSQDGNGRVQNPHTG